MTSLSLCCQTLLQTPANRQCCCYIRSHSRAWPLPHSCCSSPGSGSHACILHTVLCPQTMAHRFNNIFHITITTVSFVATTLIRYKVSSLKYVRYNFLRNPLPPVMKKGQHTNTFSFILEIRANTISQTRRGQYIQGHPKFYECSQGSNSTKVTHLLTGLDWPMLQVLQTFKPSDTW